jgi:hypothetical protein
MAQASAHIQLLGSAALIISLLNHMNVLGIRNHSSKFEPHAPDLPVSARCREAVWRRPRPQGRRSRGLRANESVLPLAGLRKGSAAMPRYYFHITNGQESLDNPKGMDLPGNATARQEAVVLASELRHGKAMAGRSWAGWFVTVVDQHGRQVDSVPIADMPDE